MHANNKHQSITAGVGGRVQGYAKKKKKYTKGLNFNCIWQVLLLPAPSGGRLGVHCYDSLYLLYSILKILHFKVCINIHSQRATGQCTYFLFRGSLLSKQLHHTNNSRIGFYKYVYFRK